MRLTLLILALVPIGCGSHSNSAQSSRSPVVTSTETYTIDPRVQSDLDQFQLDLTERGITVDWSRLNGLYLLPEGRFEDGIGGQCDEKLHIVILPVNYTIYNLWHELGHCLFNLQHTEDTREIMYPSNFCGTNSSLCRVIPTSEEKDRFANLIRGKYE